MWIFCSNFVAEKEAILKSVEHLTEVFDKKPRKAQDIFIFTDSLSALQSLESGEMGNRDISQMKIAFDHLINSHKVQ